MPPQVGVSDLVVTRDTILVHARQLPAAPQVLAGLCELLQDVNTDLDQIAAEIRVEPALAARVIRMSNSPVFGGGQRVGSVDEAVNRVGFGEVLRLVGAATVAGLVDRALGCYAIPADRLRESLLFHALASESLAAYAEID
jgi:HD-like signal output (HDOD) protein